MVSRWMEDSGLMSEPSSALPDPPAKFWWRLKVLAGGGLIVLVCHHFLTFSPRPDWFPVSVVLSQCVVVVGGVLTLWHSYLLGRSGDNSGSANSLVCRGGLYSRIRHPMYLGDMVLYLGLALLAPGWMSLTCLVLGWLALILQARTEDAYLAVRFGDAFSTWADGTGLLLPLPRKW